jgi:O-antigen ligase
MATESKIKSDQIVLGENWSFWLWCFALIYMTAPLEIILTGSDPDRSLSNPLPFYNYTRLLVGGAAIYFAFTNKPRLHDLLMVLLPYLLLIFTYFLYGASIGDLKIVIFVTVAMLGGLATAVGAYASLGGARFAKCAFYMLVGAIVISVLTAVLMPSVGVHSGLDKSGGAGRAGEWRGAYLHKNFLGHVAGITTGLLICMGRRYMRLVAWAASLGLSLLCVFMSHSSSSLVLCVALPAIFYSLIAPRGWARVASVLASTLLILVILPYRDEIIGSALDLVGKKPTLSGRTGIWAVAEKVISDAPWFGGGLGYTSSIGFREHLIALFGVNNVHNAYLDAAINFGLVGGSIYFGIIVLILLRSWSIRLSPERDQARLLLTLLMAGWAVSGLSEVMATRPYGVIAQVGTVALVGMAGLIVSGRRVKRSMVPPMHVRGKPRADFR